MRRRSTIALGFLALIAVGAVVLSSPWARAVGAWGDFGTALFTACSAVCVTGLTVVDIAQEFSRGGQIALLVLVEVGCLGLMTCSTFLLVAIGRRLSLSREFTLMNAYGVAEVQGPQAVVESGCRMLFSIVHGLAEPLRRRFELKLPKNLCEACQAAPPLEMDAGAVRKLLKLKFPEAYRICC